MAFGKKYSSMILSGLIFIVIVAVAVVVVLLQTKNAPTEMRARAADPCEAYKGGKPIPKPGFIGTIQSMKEDRFSMIIGGGPTTKVIVVCAGTTITNKSYTKLTYKNLAVGNKVTVAGNYGDNTGMTILSTSITQNSKSPVPTPTPNIYVLISALPTSGGEVLLPAGTYILNKSTGGVETYPDGTPIQSAIIINKPNVTIRGVGSGTILKLADNVKMRAFSITSNNVTIKDLVIDGNKANRNGSVPWPGGSVVDALLYGSSTAKNITVENVEVRNGIEDGIGFWKSRDVVIKNNYSHDNGTIQAGGAGISLSGVIGGQALKNRIEGNTATGIWTSFNANNITISNNSIGKNRSGGITVGGGTVDAGLGPNNSNFNITDNILSDNGVAGFASITIFASLNGTLMGNRMNTSYFDSIQVDGTDQYFSKNWVITNNICSANASDPGIRNLGHSQNISIYSNDCKGL